MSYILYKIKNFKTFKSMFLFIKQLYISNYYIIIGTIDQKV